MVHITAYLLVILLVKNQVSQYERAHRKGSGFIKVDLNSSNFSICAQFISTLRTFNPKQRCCHDKLVLLFSCSLFLANSDAPGPNPGPRPVKFPCVICDKAVRRKHLAFALTVVTGGITRDVWECQKKYTAA